MQPTNFSKHKMLTFTFLFYFLIMAHTYKVSRSYTKQIIQFSIKQHTNYLVYHHTKNIYFLHIPFKFVNLQMVLFLNQENEKLEIQQLVWHIIITDFFCKT